MAVTGMRPHTAMVGVALTACIALIELTRTIPCTAIMGLLMVTLGTGHLLGLLRAAVVVSRAHATAILLNS
jgi:hypothetical protein